MAKYKSKLRHSLNMDVLGAVLFLEIPTVKKKKKVPGFSWPHVI